MANDVNIVIGAQDQASKILADVGKSTEKLAAQMSKASEQTSKTQKTFDFALKGFIAFKVAAMAATGAVKAVTASIAGMQASVEAFNTQEEAARGMTQAQLDFAASLQVATNIGDEATLALMKQAEMLGVSKDKTEGLVLASAGLGESLRMDQATAMKLVMQATAGNTAALSRYIPELKGVTDQTEALAIIQRVAGTGLEKLQDDANTTKGAMERSAGAFGDLSEKIGALFAPIYKVTHTGLAIFAETLQTALGPAIDLVSNGFDGLQPYIDAFMEGMQAAAIVVGTTVEVIISIIRSMSGAFTSYFGKSESTTEMLTRTIDNAATFIIKSLTFIEVGIANFGTAWQMAVDSAALSMVQLANDAEHIFTVVIPAYVQWYVDNLYNMNRDIIVGILTMLQNFGKNVGEFWGNVWSWVSSGMEGGLAGLTENLSKGMFVGLTDGFEAATKELPKIAARTATNTEKELARGLGESAMKLADEYDRKVRERTAKLQESMNLSLRIDAPDLVSLGALGQADTEAVEQIKDSLGKVEKSVQQGTAVSGRLLTMGTGDVVQARIMEYTRRSAELMNRMNERMAKEMGIEVGNALKQQKEQPPVNVEVLGGLV